MAGGTRGHCSEQEEEAGEAGEAEEEEAAIRLYRAEDTTTSHSECKNTHN